MSRRRKKLHTSAGRSAGGSRVSLPVRSDLSKVICVGDGVRLYAVLIEETGRAYAFCSVCGAAIDLDFSRPVRSQLCGSCLAAAV